MGEGRMIEFTLTDVNLWFNSIRDKWYRIPERENKSWRVPKIEYGSWVNAERVIVRAGYYVSPVDMPVDLLEQRLIRHVLNSVNFYYKSKKRPVFDIRSALFDGSPLPLRDTDDLVDGPMDEEMLDLCMHSLSTWPDSFWNKLAFRVRGKWYNEEKARIAKENPSIALDYKTFWYVDHTVSQQMRDIYIRRTGKYHAPHGGYDYWGDYDYDPGGLGLGTSQKLIHIGSWGRHVALQDYKDFQVYIHPADVDWSAYQGNPFGWIYEEWEEYHE